MHFIPPMQQSIARDLCRSSRGYKEWPGMPTLTNEHDLPRTLLPTAGCTCILSTGTNPSAEMRCRSRFAGKGLSMEHVRLLQSVSSKGICPVNLRLCQYMISDSFATQFVDSRPASSDVFCGSLNLLLGQLTALQKRAMIPDARNEIFQDCVQLAIIPRCIMILMTRDPQLAL